MPNLIEAALSMLKSNIRDDDNEPVHIGEAMSCWMYFTSLSEADAMVQISLNTTTDQELKAALEQAEKMCKTQTRRLKEFMQKEGIMLPEVQAEKVDSDPSSVPFGVKMTDEEIANGLSLKVAGAIVANASTLAQSIRNDVGTMFTSFMLEQMVFGANLKSIMRNRGWLKRPPAYSPPGLPK